MQQLVDMGSRSIAAVTGTSGVTVLVVEGSTLAVQRIFPGIHALGTMVPTYISTGGVQLETKSNDIVRCDCACASI